MAFMKKDINFVLLALILAVVIILIGFTVYSQTVFKGLSEKYEEKVENLEDVTEELGLQKTKLNQTSYELEVKAQKEEDLSTRYSEVRTEKEQLEDYKAQLERQLSEKSAALIEAQAESEQKARLLVQSQADLADARDTIATLRAQKDNLQSDYNTCSAQLEACQGS